MVNFSGIITIDGPAGSGKSTIARLISQELNIAYLDTGAMFRALALFLGDCSWEWEKETLGRALEKFEFSLKGNNAGASLTLNGHLLGQEIREEQIGNWASNLGKIPVVREFLKKSQQKIGKNHSLVAEGRDMGTIVFPNAGWKFFLKASSQERARRRWKELISYGYSPEFEKIHSKIKSRDLQDQQREVAPLKPARNSIIIDTTDLSIEQVKEEILKSIVKNNSQ